MICLRQITVTTIKEYLFDHHTYLLTYDKSGTKSLALCMYMRIISNEVVSDIIVSVTPSVHNIMDNELNLKFVRK